MREQNIHVGEIVPKKSYKKIALRAVAIAWIFTLIALSLAKTEQEPVVQHNAPWIDPQLVQELKEAKKQATHWVGRASELEERILMEMGNVWDYIDSGAVEAQEESELLFLPK